MLRLLHGLFARRDGALAYLVALSLPIILVSGYFVVDLERLEVARGRLQMALDAAAMAGGRVADRGETTANDLARAVFDANLADSPTTEDVISFETQLVSVDGREMEFSAEARLRTPLTLSTIASFSEATRERDRVAARSAVRMATHTEPLELMLVIDSTLSAHSIHEKRWFQKGYARAIADEFFSDASAVQDNLRAMGIVPYVSTVNIGRSNAKAVTGQPANAHDHRYKETAWRGCVRERNADFSLDPPSALARFPVHFAPNNWSGNTWQPFPPFKIYWIEERAARPNHGPNQGCPLSRALPLAREKWRVTEAIDQLNAWWDGGGLASTGLAWAGRFLNPAWRGMLVYAHDEIRPAMPPAAVPMDLPANLSSHGRTKLAVFISSGEERFALNAPTAIGFNGEMLNTIELPSTMARTCKSLRAAGITVFSVYMSPTLGFPYSPRPYMAGCATPGDEYGGKTFFQSEASNRGAVGAELRAAVADFIKRAPGGAIASAPYFVN